MKKISDKQAVNAVKILSKYCKKRNDDCDKCIFNYSIYKNDEGFCGMNFLLSPGTWSIKELKRELKNKD